MDGISRRHNQEGQLYRSVVKTGSRVMTPAVNELADTVSKKVFPAIAGTPALSPKPLVKGGNMDKAELFCDGDRGSFWHSGAYGEPGDWYGVDYGMPIPVLEHILIQQLAAFYDVGVHNIYRLRGADWNDALDMAAENGESFAFTCAYAGNLHTLASI